jgi:glycerophosphoryl diester phosphodiesterase
VSDYFSVEHPIRFAHRGGRILYPENTMYAFNRAVEDHGYHYIELDVRLSADRVPVVVHDSTLDRTTDGSGRVAERTLAELEELDAAYHFDPGNAFPRRGTGASVPTLDEVYRTWPELRINIDLKVEGAEWAVAEVIRANDAEHRSLLGSFKDRRIRKFRRITGGSVAVSASPVRAIQMWVASRLGLAPRLSVQAYQVTEQYTGLSVDRRLVDAVHRSGAQLHVWTVNDEADMRRLLDLGVDGIMTDRPDLLNEVLDE